MDYKKAYKEALERARQFSEKPYLEDSKGIVDYIFPELKESEDEKIRKALMQNLKERFGTKGSMGEGLDMPDVLAWLEKQGNLMGALQISNARIGELIEENYYLKEQLEKQGEQKPVEPQQDMLSQEKYAKAVDECIYGEQKPTDKVEPKFKVGDFIVNDYCMGKVIELTDDAYLLDTGQGIPFSCEHNAHLWTIQDAKDGDVLSYREGQWCFIYKGIVTEDTFKYYALLSEKGITVNDSAFSLLTYCITPATKEQRDFLFQKMHEAGYEWDAEKKELKKIIDEKQIKKNLQDNSFRRMFEQKPVVEMKTPEESLGIDSETYSKIVDECIYGEQKPVESSDIKSVLLVHDEILNNLFERYKTSATFKTFIVNLQNWWNNTRRHLLSLNIKQKPAWSEEDEKIVTEIINDIECAKSINYHSSKENYEYRQNWLKSLKERYAWKPSEEQIKGIECAIKTLQHQLNVGDKRLNSLYDDLKKLRE